MKENQMKKATLLLTVLSLAVLGAAGAMAQETPTEKAIEACQPEIEAYCDQVTLGGGRLLACLYAHEDKISGRCSWLLYEGIPELEQLIAAATHLTDECWDDLEKHCKDVEMGKGRIGTCLLEHRSEVSEGCDQAIDDVDLEMVLEMVEEEEEE